jgi:hypothetical protein
MTNRKKAIHAPKKKQRQALPLLPDLVVVIEERSAVRHRSIEDAVRAYKGQNVLIRDVSDIARGNNAYVSGKLVSYPVDGKYDFKVKGHRINLRLDYLMDMLVRKN